MIRIKIPSYHESPQFWRNFVDASGAQPGQDVGSAKISRAVVEEAVVEYGARIEKVTTRRRHRRNRRWVYYDDVNPVLVFENDVDAIVFKMRWA